MLFEATPIVVVITIRSWRTRERNLTTDSSIDLRPGFGIGDRRCERSSDSRNMSCNRSDKGTECSPKSCGVEICALGTTTVNNIAYRIVHIRGHFAVSSRCDVVIRVFGVVVVVGREA